MRASTGEGGREIGIQGAQRQIASEVPIPRWPSRKNSRPSIRAQVATHLRLIEFSSQGSTPADLGPSGSPQGSTAADRKCRA